MLGGAFSWGLQELGGPVLGAEEDPEGRPRVAGVEPRDREGRPAAGVKEGLELLGERGALGGRAGEGQLGAGGCREPAEVVLRPASKGFAHLSVQQLLRLWQVVKLDLEEEGGGGGQGSETNQRRIRKGQGQGRGGTREGREQGGERGGEGRRKARWRRG